ncbi:hypothetical protein F4780DRAFT_321727 [Xylariomycetidae sp. FL0641]|nr:hypothetical protein F4780DRAFT_321727 [Xylariomycetidae sp. FL0641]
MVRGSGYLQTVAMDDGDGVEVEEFANEPNRLPHPTCISRSYPLIQSTGRCQSSREWRDVCALGGTGAPVPGRRRDQGGRYLEDGSPRMPYPQHGSASRLCSGLGAIQNFDRLPSPWLWVCIFGRTSSPKNAGRSSGCLGEAAPVMGVCAADSRGMWLQWRGAVIQRWTLAWWFLERTAGDANPTSGHGRVGHISLEAAVLGVLVCNSTRLPRCPSLMTWNDRQCENTQATYIAKQTAKMPPSLQPATGISSTIPVPPISPGLRVPASRQTMLDEPRPRLPRLACLSILQHIVGDA